MDYRLDPYRRRRDAYTPDLVNHPNSESAKVRVGAFHLLANAVTLQG